MYEHRVVPFVEYRLQRAHDFIRVHVGGCQLVALGVQPQQLHALLSHPLCVVIREHWIV